VAVTDFGGEKKQLGFKGSGYVRWRYARRGDIRRVNGGGNGRNSKRGRPSRSSQSTASEFFGHRDVGRIIGGEIMTQLQIRDRVGRHAEYRVIRRSSSPSTACCAGNPVHNSFVATDGASTCAIRDPEGAAHVGSRCANRCDSQTSRPGRCLQKPTPQRPTHEHDSSCFPIFS